METKDGGYATLSRLCATPWEHKKPELDKTDANIAAILI